ncbi:MAG TPA: hypothetical protein VIG88_04775 [Lysobacter sp.]
MIAVLATLGAGCAGTRERTAQAPPRAADPGSIYTDSVYMQRVEQTALARGIDVTWVNPPTKRARPTPR